MIADSTRFAAVRAVLDLHRHDPLRLVSILQGAHAIYGWLPQEVMAFIAVSLDISPARVFGVASYHPEFALEPRGRNLLQICDGTACHLRGTDAIMTAVRTKLGLKTGQTTTTDRAFTVLSVGCVGACGQAPMLLLGDTVHARTSPAQAVALIDAVVAREQAAAAGTPLPDPVAPPKPVPPRPVLVAAMEGNT